MTALTTTNSNLPMLPTANAAQSAYAVAAVAGVSGEGRMFPEIGIKGSRWRIKPVGDGEEQVLKTFNIQFALVNVNPNKSKTFYLQKYDPAGEPAAPDCYSDDGVAPDVNASVPQSKSCATCEHNVWGSAINEATGKKAKACKDSKRIAVMPLGVNEIYAWRLSPMNMISFADTVKFAIKQNVDIDRCLFEAVFDENSDYPHVLFKLVRGLTDDELEAVTALRNDEKAKQAVGMGAVIVNAPVRVVQAAPELPKQPEAPAAPAAAAAAANVTPINARKGKSSEKAEQGDGFDFDALLGV